MTTARSYARNECVFLQSLQQRTIENLKNVEKEKLRCIFADDVQSALAFSKNLP